MNNIIIIGYIICMLLIFIPLFIYKGICPSDNLYKQLDITKNTFDYINIITYILIGLSVFIVIISTNTCNSIYWLTMWSIVSLHIVHYIYLYNLLYLRTFNKLLLLVYTMILSLLLLSSYYINPIAGILLAPVLVWNSYLLIQFKNVKL